VPIVKGKVQMEIDESAARRDLAAAHRLAVYDGLCEGTWNHFSLMLDARRMLITPADRHWSAIDPDALVVADGDDQEARKNGLQFYIGYRIHYPVHMARPEASCVLHVHPPYTTALSLLDEEELLPASQTSVEFVGRLAYSDSYDGFGDAEKQGERIAAALGDRDILFLRGHGVVVVGRTVHEAYQDLYLLELACRTQILALSTGRRLRLFAPDEIETLSRFDDGGADARRHFDAMLGLLEAGRVDASTR
jgi:ribulose-5-phosphate 4-epimerase/fuculose-1-phosphate aldolase